ncbi:DUF3306 domain-containing protein [Halomonas salipaludis]|uniref:DUF3306 domain-containing protein n=1 Tax=Halomonas salipaludis TaxID=2032625 RepID=A0A2A2F1L0_9GAMM|nr:DUF3306 domain-containing protein [Halomonas salipaludis]PAU79326.1 hypothetical protein CK498_02840 [Halomonas salipaludis]
MNRFARWSQRKRGLESDPPPADETRHSAPLVNDADSPPADDDAALDVSSPGGGEPPPEGSLDHTLPDPDSLGPGSDFKAFLAPGVSSALKNRALRRLWASGNYNVRDGLDDYDLDYSQMRKMSAATSENVRKWGRKVLDELEEQDEAPAAVDDSESDDAAAKLESEHVARHSAESVEPPPDDER